MASSDVYGKPYKIPLIFDVLSAKEMNSYNISFKSMQFKILYTVNDEIEA